MVRYKEEEMLVTSWKFGNDSGWEIRNIKAQEWNVHHRQESWPCECDGTNVFFNSFSLIFGHLGRKKPQEANSKTREHNAFRPVKLIFTYKEADGVEFCLKVGPQLLRVCDVRALH